MGLDLARLLIPLLGFFFQCSQHHLIEPHVDLHLPRRRGEPADRQLAGEHLVEDHAQRIDVGAMIDLKRVLDLLGGHVLRRADNLTGACQRQILRLAAH